MFKYLISLIGVYCLVDFIGFIAWAVSGQYPDYTGYFIGKLTWLIIKIII